MRILLVNIIELLLRKVGSFWFPPIESGLLQTNLLIEYVLMFIFGWVVKVRIAQRRVWIKAGLLIPAGAKKILTLRRNSASL